MRSYPGQEVPELRLLYHTQYNISESFHGTPSVPLIWSQSILLKTRFGVSFGFFFVGLGMFVRGGNASVVAVNIT